MSIATAMAIGSADRGSLQETLLLRTRYSRQPFGFSWVTTLLEIHNTFEVSTNVFVSSHYHETLMGRLNLLRSERCI